MHMLFLRSSLLLLRRRNDSEAPPHSDVISVTGPLVLTDADSGNTYSLDGPMASIYLPIRATLATGWTINVQCTALHRFASATDGVGALTFEGEPYDGVQLDSLDATATITYDGTHFQAVANSGTVTGYLD